MHEQTERYRLIWFQHFHKAAGTTIVSLARRNGEVLYPENINGNPLASSGDLLPIWTYEGQRLVAFVDHCQNVGCTFLAPEWGVGDLDTLMEDPRVTTVTAVREPFERFVSNFLFDFRLGYTETKNIRDYVGSKRSFSQFNYYTRMLARLREGDVEITKKDFERAKSTLQKIDCVEIVGSKDWISKLCKTVGWRPEPIYENRTKNPGVLAIRHLLRGRPRMAWRYYQSAKLTVDDEFRSRFMLGNQMDYDLFEVSRRLSQSPPAEKSLRW